MVNDSDTLTDKNISLSDLNNAFYQTETMNVYKKVGLLNIKFIFSIYIKILKKSIL